MTTLDSRNDGALLNIEVDLLARYVERLLGRTASRQDGPGVTIDKLVDSGLLPR